MIRQRNPRSPRILSVRPITKDDLQALREPSARATLTKLRDSHHMVARHMSLGLSNNEIAQRTGFTITRISTLRYDPAMVELVSRYREKVDESFFKAADTFAELATSNMVRAERMLSDKLEEMEESNEIPTIRELVAITSDRADRFGYGKRSTQVNVNVDFAKRLEEARQRSLRVIEEETK